MAKSLIDHAIEWAENGIPVFPCGDSKQPLTEKGFYDAEVEPNKVRALFEFYGKQATMIGGRMGKEAGLFAVDVDLYKGEHAQSWYKAAVDDGSLPETRMHTTKNGGIHLLYEGVDGYFPNLNPAKGVEVKGEGGYVILPGTPGYEVAQTGLAKATPKLVERLRYAERDRGALTISDLEGNVLSGEDFHGSLTQIASKMAFKGKDLVEIQAHLRKLLEASVASSPGHDRHSRWRAIYEDRGGEFTRLVKSGYTKYNDNAIADDFAAFGNIDALFADAENIFTELGRVPGVVDELFNDDVDPFADCGYYAHEDCDLTEQTFVAYPILAEGETVVVFAEPKTGKTAVCLNLALNIACGLDYGQFKVAARGAVLYYALEGTRAIRLRVSAWRKVQREAGVKLPTHMPAFIVERATNFIKEDQRKRAAQQIIAKNKHSIKSGDGPLKAIFIDTLTKAMAGGDQNSVDDTSSLFEITSLIRAGGVTATVIFVHHKSRTGNARGSTNIEAEPDVLLDVSKKNDQVRMKIARARSIEDGAVYYFNLAGVDLGVTKQGHAIAGVVANPVEGVDAAEGDDTMEKHLMGERLGSARKAILELGLGTHKVKEVSYWLFKQGLMHGFRRAEHSSGAAQQLWHELASDDGLVYNNKVLQLEKNGANVTAIRVRNVEG